MHARSYHLTDALACLSIFDSNVPTFFAPAERNDFERFLVEEALQSPFLVIERSGEVVACGGLALGPDGSARLCWGMVERQQHNQGLGRELVRLRLRQAAADPSIRRITLNTSQLTQEFYAGLGFHVTHVVSNGHGAGLDAVSMELTLERSPAR